MAGGDTHQIMGMKHNIHEKLVTLAAISGLGLSLLAVGCDRTVSDTQETKVKGDGSVQSKEKTVTESPDGSVTKTESKKTTGPEGGSKTETTVTSTNKP